MKKLFDFISKYHTPVLTLIAYQILGVALFKIFYAKDFRCLYITADIAAIAYFLLLFIREGLNIKNKTIKYILLGISILFAFFTFMFIIQKM
ncbi:MAG: hypothetical protein WBI62_01690 [Sedimentibacter sp.]|jgi:formate hydrogenlyase subunit 3/multisubunit Na+/H+ antiporter MnhD subunit